jgi:hypothetical protein
LGDRDGGSRFEASPGNKSEILSQKKKQKTKTKQKQKKTTKKELVEWLKCDDACLDTVRP